MNHPPTAVGEIKRFLCKATPHGQLRYYDVRVASLSFACRRFRGTAGDGKIVEVEIIADHERLKQHDVAVLTD